MANKEKADRGYLIKINLQDVSLKCKQIRDRIKETICRTFFNNVMNGKKNICVCNEFAYT